MKTPLERLNSLYNYFSTNPSEIEFKYKEKHPKSTFSKQALYNIEDGKTKSITSKTALILIEVYPEIDYVWLTTGIGEMIRKEDTAFGVEKPKPPKQETVKKDNVTPIPHDNYMVVEYADLSTAAGRLGVENPAVLPEMKKRLVPKEFDNGNYLVVGVDGDSMDDGSNISIPDGTEILIKEHILHNGDKLPIRNNLFVIVSKIGTVFKQIIEHNTEEGYIVCHSYNPKYKDFSIHMDEILQIFIYRKIVSFRPSIPEIYK